MAENVNFASISFPFSKTLALQNLPTLVSLLGPQSVTFYMSYSFYIVLQAKALLKIRYFILVQEKKNQFISNSLSGSNKMIYIFILYPLLDYEFLIGKDSDSLSLIVQGTEIESALSYISYFLFLSKKVFALFLNHLYPSHICLHLLLSGLLVSSFHLSSDLLKKLLQNTSEFFPFLILTRYDPNIIYHISVNIFLMPWMF